MYDEYEDYELYAHKRSDKVKRVILPWRSVSADGMNRTKQRTM